MSIPTAAVPQIHLHWVRETPARALDFPFSSSARPLHSLPRCAQAAVLATGLDTVELHLPPYRPVSHPDLDAWFAGLRFRQDPAGRLVAEHAADPDPAASMSFHQAMVLVARAVSGDTTPLTIVAEPGRSPLLSPPPSRFHSCSPGGGLSLAPAERTPRYDRTYKRISTAVQSALRQALPPAHLLSMEQFTIRDHILALLAWSAAEPLVGRYVDELGVDVLKPDAVRKALFRAPRRLAARLAEIQEILIRNGADPALCRTYDPAKTAQIIRQCQQRPRFLHLLFANELRLILSFVGFCTKIDGWRRRAGGNSKTVFREARKDWENLETHFRGFYQRHPHAEIGSLLLVEAARVLEAVDLDNRNELRGETDSGHGWTGIHRQ